MFATGVVFFPLLGAIIAGLFGRAIGDRGAQLVTCGGLILAALCSWVVLADVVGGAPYKVEVLRWIHSGTFEADWVLRVDVLSAVMMFVVSTVSALIHVYSIGYMAHDASVPRFMSYLSLFTFFMLALVTADNFLQLYFGWEGVGLVSYLLIGFWYTRPSAAAAAIKAFLVNRVGDFGFALGIAAVYLVFDSVEFDVVFAGAPDFVDTEIVFLGMGVDTLTVICILLFIGAMGKSAQLPLHTWLPDAMEGPTPVSALIHAATMVTAGVFLVARCSPLFEYSPTALGFVAFIGATTALFAATIGLVQNDIKRVIAYSTCSQLGYMFFACGVSAYAAGIFHLYTHAFFKALLFLGAGSVIHAMSDEQDMRRMGGIWRKIPITYAVMWIGSLALAGVPFFAGYYSKDLILEAAWAAHGPFASYAFWLGILAAVLTAFYSWRLLFLTFHGEPRAAPEVMAHVHESPKVMTDPADPARRRRRLRRDRGAADGRGLGRVLAGLDLRPTRARGARGGAPRSVPGQDPAGDRRPDRDRARLRHVPARSRPAGAGRRCRCPRSTASSTTSGTSTSSTTGCSSRRPSAWASASGRRSTSA